MPNPSLRRALTKWEKRFELIDTGMLDIEICWETDDRGDGEKFDRKGGTLASQVPQLYCILLYTYYQIRFLGT